MTSNENEQVQKHFDLINSVIDVGLITAVAFLIYTQDFTGRRNAAFDNGRQLACYAGAKLINRVFATVNRGNKYVKLCSTVELLNSYDCHFL